MTAQVTSSFLPGEHYLRGTTWRSKSGKTDGHTSTIERIARSLSTSLTAIDNGGRSLAMSLHAANCDARALFSTICEDIHINLKQETQNSQGTDQQDWAGKAISLVLIRSLIVSHPHYRSSNGLFQPAEEWEQRRYLNELEQKLIDYLDARGWQIGMCWNRIPCPRHWFALVSLRYRWKPFSLRLLHHAARAHKPIL